MTRRFCYGMMRVAVVLTVAWAGVWPAYAQNATADLEPLNIELPAPFYTDSPFEYDSPNLEPVSWEPRPPFPAPKGAANVAKGKPVTASVEPLFGKLAQITDGDKSYEDKSVVSLPEGFQHVQIDLGGECELYAILVWHYHAEERVYHDFIVQVSSSADFGEGAQTLYNNDYDDSAKMGVGNNNEYIESYEGRLVDMKGVKARYVRLYSNGNTSNKGNDYIEVEVFGKPAP